MEARTRGAAESLARWATAGMLLVLLLAYRRVGALILSALPLASAAVAGLAAVGALFGSVHGITLAFGFTLLGVAQDYPLHLLSHRRPGVAPERVAAGSLADARNRHRRHLRRVPDVLVQRCRRDCSSSHFSP